MWWKITCFYIPLCGSSLAGSSHWRTGDWVPKPPDQTRAEQTRAEETRAEEEQWPQQDCYSLCKLSYTTPPSFQSGHPRFVFYHLTLRIVCTWKILTPDQLRMSSGGENKGGCAKSTAAYQSLSPPSVTNSQTHHPSTALQAANFWTLLLDSSNEHIGLCPLHKRPTRSLFYFHSVQQERLCQSATVQLLQFTTTLSMQLRTTHTTPATRAPKICSNYFVQVTAAEKTLTVPLLICN